MIERLASSGKTGLFLSVRPMFNAHVVETDADGVVRSVEDMQQADVWINGGFFVFRRDPRLHQSRRGARRSSRSARLIEQRELIAYRYEGFWEPMDTIKDKQRLDALAESGRAPWRRRAAPAPTSDASAPFSLPAAPARPPRARSRLRTPTTSRSAAAGRCSR